MRIFLCRHAHLLVTRSSSPWYRFARNGSGEMSIPKTGVTLIVTGVYRKSYRGDGEIGLRCIMQGHFLLLIARASAISCMCATGNTVETDNSICNSLTWKPRRAKMRFIPVWAGDTLSAVCLPITTLRCGGSYLTTERMPSTFCAVRMVRR